MGDAKKQVQKIFQGLPDDCSMGVIQYQLYVAEKIRHGAERAATEGTLSRQEVEEVFKQWTAQSDNHPRL